VINHRKMAVILFLIGVSCMVPLYLGAANHFSEQKVPTINASDPAQVQKPGFAPPESAQALRLEKHAPRGVKCNVCHESTEPTTSPKEEKCTTCHSIYGKKEEQLQGIPNPHKSHIGELSCGKCHKEHRESVLFCNKCHVFEMKVP